MTKLVQRRTPLQIELLAHLYTRQDKDLSPYPGDGDRTPTALQHLEAAGYVQRMPSTIINPGTSSEAVVSHRYVLTQKGTVFIEHVISLEHPVQVWTMQTGE